MSDPGIGGSEEPEKRDGVGHLRIEISKSRRVLTTKKSLAIWFYKD